MHKYHLLLQCLTPLLCLLTLTSCTITDNDIRREINNRGGRVITAANQYPLEGEHGGLTVGREVRGLFPDPGVHITAGFACPRYCWVQTVKEYLDREVVKDRTRLLSENPDANEVAVARRQNQRQTADGTVIDTTSPNANACVPNQPGRKFTDFPSFGDNLFENNQLNSSARVAIYEFETCVKCLNPETPFRECVKWFFVKVKQNATGRPTHRLVTVGTTSSPSARFEDAVRRWTAP